MRILYVHGKGEIGGSDLDLLTLIRNLDKKKFTPFVIVAKKGPFFTEYKKHAKISEQVDFTVFKSPDNLAEALKMMVGFLPSIIKIWSIIKKWKIDLVHVNGIVMPSAIIAAKLAGKPSIIRKGEIIVSHKLFGKLLDFISNIFVTRVIA